MVATVLRTYLRLHPLDNICVAVEPLPEGSTVRDGEGTVTLRQSIPCGHKFAVTPIACDAQVMKYGQPIGRATCDIQPGSWVHSHNLVFQDRRGQWEATTDIPPDPKPITGHTFLGYRRADGRAGTRNYIAVISNVNCSASAAKYIAARFDAAQLRDYSNVDGVVAFTHDGGCAMQYQGAQHRLLNRLLGGVARHPNIGGFVLVGLGCETAALDDLVRQYQLTTIDGTGESRSKLPILSIQQLGGTLRTVEAGVEAVARLLPQVNAVQREPIAASELVVGTQCGGSDGYSGITANPALGAACDRIVACGGTVILGETPEIVGAEHLLTRRAKSLDVAQKLIDRIDWWRWYTSIFGEGLDDNRSLGNAAGGLTTIAEKSLGAVAKAGTTAMCEVYEYAQPVRCRGMVVMDTPGFDPCSLTGMVAGGANIIAFTTGRGSCYGCKPVPSIKIATNSIMYQRMIDDMDLDAGQILSGATVEETGEQIFQRILAVASGEKTKSERLGIGDEEFVPWTIGPVL